jgi:hypothetical protein
MPEVTKSAVKLKAHCGCGWSEHKSNPFSVLMIGEQHAVDNSHVVQFVGECRVAKRAKPRRERSRDYKRESNVNVSNL